ncbi:MAG: hypothetical protein V4736_08335 [Bdellovibrionota bacterium]
MIKILIESAIKKFGQKYNYDASYLRHIADTSTSLIFKFNKFVKLSQYRKVTPVEIFYLAKIGALRVADCGPCLQLNVDFALEKNVSAEVLNDALKNPTSLSADHKLAYDFGFAMALNSDDHTDISEKFEKRFGKAVLVETSMAVATTLVYPILKRGLRYSKACHLVDVKVKS